MIIGKDASFVYKEGIYFLRVSHVSVPDIEFDITKILQDLKRKKNIQQFGEKTFFRVFFHGYQALYP